MKEFRCVNCGKLLFKYEGEIKNIIIEKKCDKCKKINIIKEPKKIGN